VSGFYEVKASDAHAWAEIYFEGYGWMIFDPVPGENANPQLGEAQETEWLLEALLNYLEVPPAVRAVLPGLLRLFLGLSLAALLFALVKRSPKSKSFPTSDFAPYLETAEKFTEPRRTGETVKDWSRRLKEHPELTVLAQVYEDRFYRDLPLENSQRKELDEVLTTLKKRHKESGKTQP
jgi:hypothetical protein